MTPDGKMKISTWHARGAVGAFSLLVVGFLGGMMADRFVVAHEGDRHGVIVTPDEEAVASFKAVLELDDEQLAAIHEILMRNQGHVDEAWEGLRDEIRASVERVHVEIRDLLTDEQRALFADWLEHHVRSDLHGDPAFRWAH